MKLLGFVFHKALDLLQTEFYSISNVSLSIKNCGCVLWQVNGLPSAHMLADFRHSQGFIPLNVIDSYWKQLSCTLPTLHRSTLDFFDLPEIIALKSRYDESPDHVRLVMQQDLKVLAFPQTTTILEPPVATIKKVDLQKMTSRLNETLLTLNMSKRHCLVAQITLRFVRI